MFDHDLRAIDSEAIEHEQISTQPGWVEHDSEVIYANVLHCLSKVSERQGLNAGNVKAIGITNQRETTVAFHR